MLISATQKFNRRNFNDYLVVNKCNRSSSFPTFEEFVTLLYKNFTNYRHKIIVAAVVTYDILFDNLNHVTKHATVLQNNSSIFIL